MVWAKTQRYEHNLIGDSMRDRLFLAVIALILSITLWIARRHYIQENEYSDLQLMMPPH